jgi:hypothetical protein
MRAGCGCGEAREVYKGIQGKLIREWARSEDAAFREVDQEA